MIGRIAPDRPTPPMPDENNPRRPEPVVTLPTHDEIAARAHQIYVMNGCIAGESEQNWLQAERELVAEIVARTMRYYEEASPADAYMYESWELQEFVTPRPLRIHSRIEAA